MLCQICRRGHLSGITHDYIQSNTLFGEALKILFPDATTNPVETLAPIQYSSMETAWYNSKGVTLEIYNEILKLVNSKLSTIFFDITMTFLILQMLSFYHCLQFLLRKLNTMVSVTQLFHHTLAIVLSPMVTWTQDL